MCERSRAGFVAPLALPPGTSPNFRYQSPASPLMLTDQPSRGGRKWGNICRLRWSAVGLVRRDEIEAVSTFHLQRGQSPLPGAGSHVSWKPSGRATERNVGIGCEKGLSQSCPELSSA